ncbi:sugar transferase [Bacillus hwajinpoensis]|uniref:Sugar transferase n=1 Tax=Guptibacillus hwajinpoensis TaxID=208199 RepID=A0A845EP99_9BACL|nr:sugar transferase [Pseudalkalibacillus hwajinpoensis]MYL62251.1 sugar transferase [Pseudalkalibacillus hwajinpoensis]
MQERSFLFSKRLVDICVASVGLIITLPVFIIISFLYLFGESKGPLFFKQKRYGKNGEMFNIYKFRSMVMRADEKLRENDALYQKYLENNYKLEQHEDPRITKLGRFLRSSSLDELPQLINVIKGEMSLIGPRPVVEDELKEYKDQANLFLSVKPGVTGFWQVSGRSEIGYPERVDLELHYVYNQSAKFDAKILFRTFIIVFLKKGAY